MSRERGGRGRSAAQRPEGLVPPLPEQADPALLDRAVRRELTSLPAGRADGVARHLAAAAVLLADDPEAALEHARYAKRLGGRVGVVREAAGLAAYRCGRWEEARSELRAHRRLTGSDVHLPLLADCERGLGHPERALSLTRDRAAQRLDASGRVELRIVASGARRDLGQYDAAVVALQGPELSATEPHEWTARLWYAYADALADAGRADEALDWFRRTAAADPQAGTDAVERILELEGTVLVDVGHQPELDAGDEA